jgi:hypothetical protein
VLRCKYYFGMNERVIGFLMGMSVEKVKGHAKRGKLLLREFLGSDGTMHGQADRSSAIRHLTSRRQAMASDCRGHRETRE